MRTNVFCNCNACIWWTKQASDPEQSTLGLCIRNVIEIDTDGRCTLFDPDKTIKDISQNDTHHSDSG